MTSHQLAIAKASFSAGLLRPDPTSLSREEIAHFHSLLDSAVIQCTPANVQNCKRWILQNIIQSTARFTALGKYITALAASFTENRDRLDSASKREPSIKRKRLHLLYLVNDILYHAKYRINDASIGGKLQPILVNLLGSAASFASSPKHHRKIADLLSIWEEKGYYSNEYIDKLRETVKNASEAGSYAEGAATPSGDVAQGSSVKLASSAPYVMPAMHGDPSTPWFDLPAGNLMPHIVPNSTRPINPDMIKPLQFVAGPADETLVLAVKNLLDDVQKIFEGEKDQDEKVAWDIDELGQPIVLDEITGDVIEGEGYYGWSRSFCEKMKRRRKGLDIPGRDGSRGRTSRSRSSSRGRKRRRHSDSDGSSPGSYRASRPRRTYSSSRSASPDARPAFKGGRSRSRSRNRSYSRSAPRSPRQAEAAPSQRPHDPREGFPQQPPAPFIPPVPFQNGYNAHYPPPPPPPNVPFNGSGQPQYGSWPIPPPPFHNPAWPPPPPPPGPGNFHQQPQGGFPPPPPPGPGGWQPPMQHGNGRGYHNGWNNNRGGRGNYRGRGWS